MRKLGICFLLGASTLFALAPLARAQREIPERTTRGTGFVFNFGPPGARALAMGGTFIGFADDATASEANPAGLVILPEPQVSAHFGFSSFENESEVDFVGTTRRFDETVFKPSFFSYVQPVRNAAIAVYYQQTASFELFAPFDDVFLGDLLDPGDDVRIAFDDTLDLLVQTFAVSGAVRLGEHVAVGGSVRVSRVDWDQVSNFTLDFAPAGFAGDTVTFTDTIVEDDSTAVTFNAGVLVNPGGRVSGGFVFKQGAEFGLTQADSCTDTGFFRDIGFCSDLFVPTTVQRTFSSPDVFAGGVAVGVTDSLRVGLDVVHITYTDLVDADPPNLPVQFIVDVDLDSTQVDDETEVHVGGEYTFNLGGGSNVSLRGGVFNDPDHDGNAGVDSEQVHGTFGAGAVIRRVFQVDGAVSVSDQIKEFLVSFVYRFR